MNREGVVRDRMLLGGGGGEGALGYNNLKKKTPPLFWEVLKWERGRGEKGSAFLKKILKK